MYAIIKTGGKQYRVAEGDVITIEKLEAAANDSVTFEEVLTVVNDGDVKVGAPLVNGAKVTGTVLEHGKGKKILVFKYKAKSNYRRRQGHRQPFTKVRIESIQAELWFPLKSSGIVKIKSLVVTYPVMQDMMSMASISYVPQCPPCRQRQC